MATRAITLFVVLAFLVAGCVPDPRRVKMQPRSRNEPPRYLLPTTEIPDSVRDTLHPWIAGFVGLSPAEATKRLHERWATIDRPSLVALRNTLSDFEVRAIVDDGAGGMIYAERVDAEDTLVGNVFFLPAPIDSEILESHLASVELSGNQAVRDFMTHFGGLSEDVSTAGHFIYLDSPWPTFTDSWENSIEGFDEWQNSLMIYHARNGCSVLVHPTGKVAWWMMQEHRVEELADNFDEFVNRFSDHRKLAWPFDPYGP